MESSNPRIFSMEYYQLLHTCTFKNDPDKLEEYTNLGTRRLHKKVFHNDSFMEKNTFKPQQTHENSGR